MNRTQKHTIQKAQQLYSTRFLWYFLLFNIFLFNYVAIAQEKPNEFVVSIKSIDIEQGLASREVYTGVQDGNGFLWFGTRNGLNRYDGKKFQLYTKRSHKMQENNVVKVATDLHDQLFILYGYSGYARLAIGKVDILSTSTSQIKSLSETFRNLPFKESDVYWISNDGSDRVNIMTKNPYKLWQYTYKEGFKLQLEMTAWKTDKYDYSVPTGPFNLFYKNYACLGFNGNEKQLIVNNGKTNEVVPINRKGIYKAIATNSKKEMLVYESDFMFNHIKYYLLDSLGKKIETNESQINKLNPAATNGSLAIPVSGDTTCILNIKNRGLFLFNQKALLKIIDATDINNYTNLIVNECFIDQLGNIWICCSSGVYKVKVKKNKFTQYFTKYQQTLVDNNQARGILQDEKGHLYANLWDRMLIYKNGKTEEVFSKKITYALFKHNEKIVSTSFDLLQYQPEGKYFTPLKNTRPDRDIISAYSLNDSIILIGKMEQIFRYNTNTSKLTQIKTPEKGIYIPYRFYKRKDGTFWVVGENGIYLLNNNGDVLDYFNGKQKNISHKLPADNFTDVFEDEQGFVWLASHGDGLFKWDRKNNSFKHFNLEEGMPSSVLYRIEEDEEKNLWISTENGLVCLNPKTQVINSFFEKDGLSHNEFNRASSYKSEDGKMFFGGMNGVIAFYPKQVLTDTSSLVVKLNIISFQQFSAKENKLLDLTSTLIQNKSIVLEPGDKFFNLEFRLLDFENQSNQYAYKIVGQDKDWIYTTDNNIRVSGLPFGNYTLMIKGQTSSGQWSTNQLSIPIEVKAPIHRKLWVQLLFLSVLIVGILFLFNYRTNVLKKEKNILEKKVNKRTEQLQKSLSERELLLKEIHHRVKNNLQIISGLLDLQKEEIEGEKSKAIFNEGQSRVKSIALIHQNLYQNEDLGNVQFSSFVKEMAAQVSEIFEHLNSKMLINVNVPDLVFDIDTAVPLGLIINELLTNSFKYASIKDKSGEINIQIDEVAKGNFKLVYSDNGLGINPSINFETANTLGLRLIRGLAAQLFGEAVYSYNNGSVFTITFKDLAERKVEH